MRNAVLIILFFVALGALSYFLMTKPQEAPLIKSVHSGKMTLSSTAFQNMEKIPKKHTCDGEDVNPPLSITGIPEKTQSLVLIVDDPDAPMGTWTHWLVWNIAPAFRTLSEKSIPESGVEGKNSGGIYGYEGPCPPSGTHRYFFKIYAIDANLETPKDVSPENLMKAIEGHILDSAELIGTYSREASGTR